VADAKELNAEELDEVILEACADQAVDLVIEAILVADAKELNAEQPIEATLDNTVDPSIKAIQAAERSDKEAEGPRFESKIH
jgi:hypothetical protein